MLATANSSSPNWPALSSALAETETLTLAEWADLLGCHRTSLYKKAPATHAAMREVNGLLTRCYALAQLAPDHQEQLRAVLHRSNCQSFLDVLARRRMNGARWRPDFSFASKPPGAQLRAMYRREVMRVFFAVRNSPNTREYQAVDRARVMWHEKFGKPCDAKTIRRWAKRVDECNGIELAPLEAYCDNKDVPHLNARKDVKGEIPRELIATFRAYCVEPGMEHMRGAFRKMEIDWLSGRDVPGLGITSPGAAFPFKFEQLRKYAPSTPARRLGSHGKARALREALPHTPSTRVALRFGQRYVFDDSRADIIATDDRTGEPVEMKFYVAMDAATRRIVAWVMRQSSIGGSMAVTHDDVNALVARVLASSGFASDEAPFHTELKFERGTVACSPAKQTLLEGLYPGRIRISRTTMNGGKNFAGDFKQESSGNWMGKAEIESFMRTLSFYCQHLPGQRGGDYRRQPAHLGLKGKNSAGMLDWHAGSQLHEAARLEYANRALEIIDPRQLETQSIEWRGPRLRVSALKPVSWVQDAVKAAIAYYNARTDHRMEGFDAIECIGAQGELVRRMESPNERAARLMRECPTQRLNEADLALLLNMRAKTVTVKPNGAVITIGDYERCLFWREDSIACAQAARNATLEKKFVALYDEDAFATWTAESPYRREIYLLADVPASWVPGQPGRFLEALPLAHIPDRTNPEEMASALEKRKRVERRYASEVLHAAGPRLAEKLAETADNVRELAGVVSMIREAGPRAGESQLRREIREAQESAAASCEPAPPTRKSQQATAASAYAARLAQKNTAEVES